MNQDPKVLLEFKTNNTRYRLVFDGIGYQLHAKSEWSETPSGWYSANSSVDELFTYLRQELNK